MHKSVTTKRAFTLAEVLITLGVIGVVAAISMPTLMKYLSTRELDTARTTMSAKLVEAMKQMQVREELTGYNTSEEFAEAFKKYMKVTNVCDSTKLEDCFGYTTLSDNSGHSIDVSKMATVSKILPESFDSNKYPSTTVGIQFVNGVTGVMTYKKDCEWQNPMETGGENTAAMECLTLVYDVNGAKKPNKLNQDIILINAKLPSLCVQFADGVCGTFYAAGSYSPIDCKNTSGPDYEYCQSSTYTNKDYWAGAARLCGGQNKIASDDDLTKIAQVLYHDTSIQEAYKTGLTLDYAKAAELGLPSSGSFYIWSSALYQAHLAYTRNFTSTRTNASNSSRDDIFNLTLSVICKE